MGKWDFLSSVLVGVLNLASELDIRRSEPDSEIKTAVPVVSHPSWACCWGVTGTCLSKETLRNDH